MFYDYKQLSNSGSYDLVGKNSTDRLRTDYSVLAKSYSAMLKPIKSHRRWTHRHDGQRVSLSKLSMQIDSIFIRSKKKKKKTI